MATTYDLERQSYITEWTPFDTSPGHWSSSPEWKAYVAARAKATERQIVDPLSPRELITETEDMRVALERFNKRFPPVDEPTPVIDAHSAELRSAELELQRAVTRMRAFAHPDRVADLAKRYAYEC